MEPHRLYRDLSYLWPLFSPPEEYADEKPIYLDIIRSKLGPGRHTILELGVGGGHLLSHLTSDHDATAVDISQEMLALSQHLNPYSESPCRRYADSVRLGAKIRLRPDIRCHRLHAHRGRHFAGPRHGTCPPQPQWPSPRSLPTGFARPTPANTPCIGTKTTETPSLMSPSTFPTSTPQQHHSRIDLHLHPPPRRPS